MGPMCKISIKTNRSYSGNDHLQQIKRHEAQKRKTPAFAGYNEMLAEMPSSAAHIIPNLFYLPKFGLSRRIAQNLGRPAPQFHNPASIRPVSPAIVH